MKATKKAFPALRDAQRWPEVRERIMRENRANNRRDRQAARELLLDDEERNARNRPGAGGQRQVFDEDSESEYSGSSEYYDEESYDDEEEDNPPNANSQSNNAQADNQASQRDTSSINAASNGN